MQYDEEQLSLAKKLDSLRQDLIRSDADILPADALSQDLFSDTKPKGILEILTIKARQSSFWLRHGKFFQRVPNGVYIHGSVGVGKSFIMDQFVDSLTTTQDNANTVYLIQNRRFVRIHFHEFMLQVHDRIHKFKLQHPRQDPLPPVALSIAQESRLLCLDEFQVTDIADAAILKRLLEMLWTSQTGMVLVATSNRAPKDLYEGGLNRSIFLPFIDTLTSRMDVVAMTGCKDYRREQQDHTSDSNLASIEERQSYFWPADEPTTRRALERIFSKGQSGSGEHHESSIVRIPVRMGRYVTIPRSNDGCAWFDFDDLCKRPLGAADYLSICERFKTLIIDHVPQLDGSKFNEARRFVTLIDAVYESRIRLILASNDVPLHELLVGFDATVESNDGDEEIAVQDVGAQQKGDRSPSQEIFVKGEGGSSSSAATTMVRNRNGEAVEWSATGRIGVSLAQLSAVKDVSFSFQRAESRLVEMNSATWFERTQ